MVKGTVCKTVVRWFDSNYGLKIHGGCSSEEEHLVVVQDVVGSSPINHPNTEEFRGKKYVSTKHGSTTEKHSGSNPTIWFLSSMD